MVRIEAHTDRIVGVCLEKETEVRRNRTRVRWVVVGLAVVTISLIAAGRVNAKWPPFDGSRPAVYITQWTSLEMDAYEYGDAFKPFQDAGIWYNFDLISHQDSYGDLGADGREYFASQFLIVPGDWCKATMRDSDWPKYNIPEYWDEMGWDRNRFTDGQRFPDEDLSEFGAIYNYVVDGGAVWVIDDGTCPDRADRPIGHHLYGVVDGSNAVGSGKVFVGQAGPADIDWLLDDGITWIHSVYLPKVDNNSIWDVISTPEPTPEPVDENCLEIVDVDSGKGADYPTAESVQIVNCGRARNLKGYTLEDIAGHTYTFPDIDVPGIGDPTHGGDPVSVEDATVYVHTDSGEYPNDLPGQHLYWGRGSAVWNNDGDCATLADFYGEILNEYCYGGSGSFEVNSN
jgi:hypothetical protein